MDPNKSKQTHRLKRHRHIRKRVAGTPERPRLCVFRSNKHTYVQVIDDWHGRTLASTSTLGAELRGQTGSGATVEAASLVGELIARKCLQSSISKLVFDRGGYRYHGRVRAVAEAARKQFSDADAEGF